METLLKISFHVCLFAVSLGFQLSPSFNIKTPVDFDLDIDALKAELQNDYPFSSTPEVRSFSATRDCFCFPNNSNSQLVTEHLNPDGDIERLVVYFYKVDGSLQVFIPNYQKQVMIPDLDYDKSEGDVLKPAFSNTAYQIFKDSPVIVLPKPSVPADQDENENDKVNMDSVDYTYNSDSDSESENKPEVIDTNNNEDDEDKAVSSQTNDEGYEESAVIDNNNSNVDAESTSSVQTDNDTNNEDNALIQEIFEITTESTASIQESSDIGTESTITNQTSNDKINDSTPSVETNDLPEVDESTESEDPSDISFVKPSGETEEGIQKPTDEETKPIFDLVQPLANKPIFNHITGDKNIYDNNHLQKILSILPPDAKVYLESLISQLKNPYSDVTTGNNYITFDNWFKDQLTRVVIQNLDTSSDIKALRNRIVKVLEKNGMYLTKKGVLIDSMGNIRKLTNIKLRPILIGDPVEYQNMLNYQSNQARPMEISYLQVILITQVNPPSILGVVPLGKVYLPRKLKRKQKIYFLSDPEFVRSRSGPAPTPRLGTCKTCKSPFSPKNAKPNITPNFQQFPFKGNRQLMRQLIKKPEDSNISPQPQRRVSNEMGNNFNNIVRRLFGILGSPNDFDDQTRRLLGGGVFKPVPKPQTEHPKDDLPGIRIIGGNPATSSGTPLVTKGRSAFEIPRIF